jgi:hypothetical protein
MMDIYPEFADHVAFYAVGQDPTESLDDLERTRKERGYTWPVAEPIEKMLVDLWVIRESTKIVFDGDGVVVYRKKGGGDASAWPGVFSKLAETSLQ